MTEIADLLYVDEVTEAFRRARASHVSEALNSIGLSHNLIDGQSLSDYSFAAEVAHSIRERVSGSDTSSTLRSEVTRGLRFLDTAAASRSEALGAVPALGCDGLAEDGCAVDSPAQIRRLSSPEMSLLGAAGDVLEELHLSQVFADNVGLIIVLGVATTGAPVATWATGAFPYTVHLHLMPRAELIARDLIHEATHNHLNDWLGARALELDARTPLYWSPWKDSKRPLFGFTHSIIAFSVVTVLMSGLLNDATHDRRWLRSFRDGELSRLRESNRTVREALKELPDELSERVRHVYEAALSG